MPTPEYSTLHRYWSGVFVFVLYDREPIFRELAPFVFVTVIPSVVPAVKVLVVRSRADFELEDK